MSDKTPKKRVNKTKEELVGYLEAKSEVEKNRLFWEDIRAIEEKHQRRCIALIDPNIMRGIMPILTSIPLEKKGVEKTETTKEEETVV
jgi:hypothetical protein